MNVVMFLKLYNCLNFARPPGRVVSAALAAANGDPE
jgi:hypothetical protein